MRKATDTTPVVPGTGPGISRRRLLQIAVVAVPAVVGACGRPPAVEEETTVQKLRAEDPVARSLLYVPDTRQVPADHPLAARHDPKQKCGNCVHVRGNPGDTWRPCPVFPARLVNAGGWCSVWASA